MPIEWAVDRDKDSVQDEAALSAEKACSFHAEEETVMNRCVRGMVVTLALVPALALAEQPTAKAAGVESKEQARNAAGTETIKALQAKGNVKSGEEIYKAYCAACHLPSGGGNPDGSIPQLAGQHATVVIKQLADIRFGLRYNPTMQPFARKLADAQEIADVAAYISTLCIPADSGKYAGLDAVEMVAGGKLLYEMDCSQCHKPRGQGVKETFYPVLAGQHYRYLLRQMTDIRDGKRGNAHPEMIQVARKYNYDQLLAISAYLATLTTPQSMIMAKPHMCKTAATEVSTTR